MDLMDSRLRRFPPDRASAIPRGQGVQTTSCFAHLAHRSAAAHKLHSPRHKQLKIISQRGPKCSLASCSKSVKFGVPKSLKQAPQLAPLRAIMGGSIRAVSDSCHAAHRHSAKARYWWCHYRVVIGESPPDEVFNGIKHWNAWHVISLSWQYLFSRVLPAFSSPPAHPPDPSIAASCRAVRRGIQPGCSWRAPCYVPCAQAGAR